MREAIKVFQRFLIKYKGYLSMNIIFNILGAIFGIFSFITLIPLLKVLFNVNNKVYEYKEVIFSFKNFDTFRNRLMNNLYYNISNMINNN